MCIRDSHRGRRCGGFLCRLVAVTRGQLAEIDGEMRDIIDEAYETCRRTLTEHIDQLHALAQALMEREKLNEKEFLSLIHI